METVHGFSKLSKVAKINWIKSQFSSLNENAFDLMKDFWHPDQKIQKVFDEFSENTLSNYFLPFGVAPNFKINNKIYTVPMVIEESSVVAAASKAAKFWLDRGGFHSIVKSVTKVGHVHFEWSGEPEKFQAFFNENKHHLLEVVKPVTLNMEKRGGGILSVELLNKTEELENYYQLEVKFHTCDAMGANFINSVLELMASQLKKLVNTWSAFEAKSRDVTIIMAILSNYTPECLVECFVECELEVLGEQSGLSAEVFVQKMLKASKIARIDRSRAVTHNKGILNGIDAIVLATGNDFRAVEACIHAYAAKDGQYRGLTKASLNDGKFRFSIELPLSLGTVGGLTNLHPLVKTSLEMLGRPSARELMEVAAALGLAQNFSALRSLVTTGIQKGHMKMHLLNILNQLEANQDEIESAKKYFEKHLVSFNAVRDFLKNGRLKRGELH